MPEQIRTKIFQSGDKCESTWPPQFGTGESGHFYVDHETGELIKGFPPPRNEKFGDAPFIITDTIDPYYHPSTLQTVDSKSKLKMLDKQTGCITTDKKLPPDPSWHNEQKRKRREDGHRALHKAVAQIDNGTAPLTDEMKHKCDIQNEVVSNALNFDAFNVAGRKNNPKGKKFRR